MTTIAIGRLASMDTDRALTVRRTSRFSIVANATTSHPSPSLPAAVARAVSGYAFPQPLTRVTIVI
jgi:hypothetical protein